MIRMEFLHRLKACSSLLKNGQIISRKFKFEVLCLTAMNSIHDVIPADVITSSVQLPHNPIRTVGLDITITTTFFARFRCVISIQALMDFHYVASPPPSLPATKIHPPWRLSCTDKHWQFIEGACFVLVERGKVFALLVCAFDYHDIMALLQRAHHKIRLTFEKHNACDLLIAKPAVSLVVLCRNSKQRNR